MSFRESDLSSVEGRRAPAGSKRYSILSLMVCILQHMGRRNYLIEGLSGTGKTSVCDDCSGAAITPFMATASWLTKTIRKLVDRRRSADTSTTSGM